MTSPTPHQQQHPVAGTSGASTDKRASDSPTMDATQSTANSNKRGLMMKPLVVKMPSLRNVRSVGNLDMIASTFSGGGSSSSSRSGGLSKPILRKHKSVSTGLQSASSNSGNQNFEWNGSGKPHASAVDLRALTRPTLRGCLSSGSNHSTNSAGSRSDKMKRSVSFSKIQVREYERTIGDNVVSCGVPVSLGWNSTNLGDMDVDTYEQHKQPRSREEMLLPSHVRMEMTKHAGFSLKERMDAAKASNIERNRRVRSKAKTLEMDKVDYALEKASRSLTKLRRKISPMNVTKKIGNNKPRSGSSSSDVAAAADATADFEIEELIRMDRLRTKQMQELRKSQSDPMLDLDDSSDEDDQTTPTSQQNSASKQQFRRSSASDPNLFTTGLLIDDESDHRHQNPQEQAPPPQDGSTTTATTTTAGTAPGAATDADNNNKEDQEQEPIFGKAPIKRRSLLVDDSDADRHRDHFDSSEFNLSDSNLDLAGAEEEQENKEVKEGAEVVDNRRIKEDIQQATEDTQLEC